MCTMVKRKIFLFFILAILIAIVFFLNKLGIVGNSDTQLGVNIKNILYSGFFIWQTSNSGGEHVFPSLVPMFFQSFFNLFNLSISNPGLIIAILFVTVFVAYKFICSILKIENNAGKLIILLISLFSINNDHISNAIITNSTTIWTFFSFISSLYLFFLYHSQKKIIHLFLLIFMMSLVFMDFHMGLLAVFFISTFLIIEFLYDWLSTNEINFGSIKELAIILLFLTLANSYWLVNNIGDLFLNKNSLYNHYISSQNNTNAVKDAVTGYVSPSYNFILAQIKNLDGKWFYQIDIVASFIIIIFVLAGLLFVRKEKDKMVKKTVFIVIIQYLFFTSLSLGTRNPLGIFDFFWRHIPMFRIFRDFMKFNRLVIPIVVIIVSYSLIKIIQHKEKVKKPLLVLVILLMAVKFYPYYANFSQYKPYKIPDYYYDYYEFTKSNKLQDKTQLLPVISWYQGYTWSNQDYDMQEPIGYFTAKPMFVNSATYEENFEEKTNGEISELLKKNSRENLFGLTSLRNMKYFLLRNDLQKKYLEKSKKDTESLRNSIDSNEDLELLKKFGYLSLYSIDSKYFLPHLYVPKNSIISKRTTDELPRIFKQENYDISSAVFFEKQNEGKKNILEILNKKNENNPVLEIKKINPTKYRVRVHGASGVFPLVFSESFHEGWKAYIDQNANLKNKNDNAKLKIADYKIIDNNEDDQASKDELIGYIKNRYVTTLGDGKEKTIIHKKWENMKEKTDYTEKYKIDFISKNFQGTIQNDNLPGGNIFETWFKNPVDNNKNHLIANGYANSWIINSDKICLDNKCLKNPDGTYDFEMVVEFWPQRLFYIGLFISTLTFLASIFCLVYNYKERANNES